MKNNLIHFVDENHRYLSDNSGGLLKAGLIHSDLDRTLSIITVSLNCLTELMVTISSVLNQCSDNIELIVIDGNSSDGTVEYLQTLNDHINYWISEKDDGIYDAMNKGILYLNGKFHMFLNAGDFFVGKVFDTDIHAPIFLDVYYKNIFGRVKKVPIFNYRLKLPNNHQGIIFESKGILYDKSIKISADYQYYIDHGYRKLAKIKTKGFVYFDNNGTSANNFIERDNEISHIVKKNFGLKYYFIFKIYSIAKVVLRKIYNAI